MRLATLRTDDATIAVRIDEEFAIEIRDAPDVGTLLNDADWRTRGRNADGPRRALADIADSKWAPVIPRPGKIICVGLNYRDHILEMGRGLPTFPTLFAKYPESLIGPYDPIALPRIAPGSMDWEAELAVVIGARARHLSVDEAETAVAGYSVLNDVTARDFQNRTAQWLQGKTFEATTPFGPVLVTADEFKLGQMLRASLNTEMVQESRTDGLVFGPAALVSYISHIITLSPGDVIATGTPGGVGHARRPPRYLTPGALLTTSIEGIGELRNLVVAGD